MPKTRCRAAYAFQDRPHEVLQCVREWHADDLHVAANGRDWTDAAELRLRRASDHAPR